MNPATPETPPARPLLQQRCYHHGDREAAARCSGCGRFYCRECVSPFDHRLLCAGCIRAAAEGPPLPARPRRVLATPVFQALVGLLVLWMVFYITGSILLNIPNTFQVEPEAAGYVEADDLPDGSVPQ